MADRPNGQEVKIKLRLFTLVTSMNFDECGASVPGPSPARVKKRRESRSLQRKEPIYASRKLWPCEDDGHDKRHDKREGDENEARPWIDSPSAERLRTVRLRRDSSFGLDFPYRGSLSSPYVLPSGKGGRHV